MRPEGPQVVERDVGKNKFSFSLWAALGDVWWGIPKALWAKNYNQKGHNPTDWRLSYSPRGAGGASSGLLSVCPSAACTHLEVCGPCGTPSQSPTRCVHYWQNKSRWVYSPLVTYSSYRIGVRIAKYEMPQDVDGDKLWKLMDFVNWSRHQWIKAGSVCELPINIFPELNPPRRSALIQPNPELPVISIPAYSQAERLLTRSSLHTLPLNPNSSFPTWELA